MNMYSRCKNNPYLSWYIQASPSKPAYTYFDRCWKCNEFSHLAKECKNSPSHTNQTDHITQEQTMINTYRNAHSTPLVSQIKYHTIIYSSKPPILTQQITTDLQLSQVAWNQLSSQMNEMVETNKLLKKAVQDSYIKLTNVQKQNPKNLQNSKKTATKWGKAVNLFTTKLKIPRLIVKPIKRNLTQITIKRIKWTKMIL